MPQPSLNSLWNLVPSQDRIFCSEMLSDLPGAAKRYLEHAIAPGTKLASAVRLRMSGEIKLKNWIPFQAEQVICWNRGMIWSAIAWMNGLPIRGSDRIIAGVGSMEWKLFGLFPVMTATGTDVTRSAIGRMQGESIWLPSVLCNSFVTWAASDEFHAHATLNLFSETTELLLTVSNNGRLEAMRFQRWGNPDNQPPAYASFGGFTI